MAEILVKLSHNPHPNPDKEQRFGWHPGHCLVVKEDGWTWGRRETLPSFFILKIPGIPTSRIEKYIRTKTEESVDDKGFPVSKCVRQRQWRIRYGDIPAVAKIKILTTGQLIVKATNRYNGPFDYTWDQIRGFFRNIDTNQDESNTLE